MDLTSEQSDPQNKENLSLDQKNPQKPENQKNQKMDILEESQPFATITVESIQELLPTTPKKDAPRAPLAKITPNLDMKTM